MDLEEVVEQVLLDRQAQPAALSHSPGVGLGRGHELAGRLGLGQPLVGRVVVHLPDPLAQDLLQLADVVKRPVLGVLAARGDVRTLVALELVQQ